MLIKVEQHHIDAGRREDAFYCPVACAIREAGEYDEVGVDECSISAYKGKGHRRRFVSYYPTPPIVALAIRRYDNGMGMSEFSFELGGDD